MKKIIVGILPKIKINKSNNPYDDKYEFLDVYTKKVIECGAIPFGICLNNGNLDIDSLKICDCIILPGGDKIDKCYFEVIDYAIKNNIPLLGICLGFQAIALYSMVIEDENYNGSNFFDIYNKLKKENDNTLLKRIENHRKLEINYDNYKEAMHEINLNKNSLIYNAYKQEKVNVVSLHNFTPKYIGNNFKITAQSNDNIVEAIEYDSTNHYIVGVSFHPEWDENNYLIKRLIKEGKRID